MFSILLHLSWCRQLTFMYSYLSLLNFFRQLTTFKPCETSFSPYASYLDPYSPYLHDSNPNYGFMQAVDPRLSQ